MTIPLSQPRTSTPVVKRRAIGEVFVGAITGIEQRDAKKIDGTPRLNAKGTQAKEAIVSCLSMPPTTMPAGLGGRDAVPTAGDEVRAIFVSGGLAQWIEAQRNLGGSVNVGDILVMTTDHGVLYDVSGNKKGEFRTQAEIDAYVLPRTENIGLRGELRVRRAKPEEAEWVQRAERAYHTSTAIPLTDAPAGVSAADLF